MNAGATKSKNQRETLPMKKTKELQELVAQLMKLDDKQSDSNDERLKHHRDAYGMLERIRRLEPKLRTTNGRPRRENVDHFNKWLQSNGCVLRNVRIAEQAEFGGMGLEYTGSSFDGLSIIEVPQELFFYVKSEPAFDQLHELMLPDVMRERAHIVLATVLIIERFRKGSFWKPYFDVLPERYTTPLYYSPEDMAELIETDAFQPALDLCKNIIRQYTIMRRFIIDKVDGLRNNFTYDIFRWAVSTVMTRQNKIPDNLGGFDGVDSTLALIPFWDMANHAHDNGSKRDQRLIAQTLYNTEAKRLECCLGQSDSITNLTGAPVFITYGQRTDAEFLVHNGFAMQGNPHTSIMVKFELNSEASDYKERVHLLEQLNLPTASRYTFSSRNLDLMRGGILPISRVYAMDINDVRDWSAKDPEQLKKLLCSEEQIPSYMEHRVQVAYARIATKALKVYPTTIAQDESLLASNRQMHHIRRVLIEYRLAEKRMLNEFIECYRRTVQTSCSISRE